MGLYDNLVLKMNYELIIVVESGVADELGVWSVVIAAKPLKGLKLVIGYSLMNGPPALFL